MINEDLKKTDDWVEVDLIGAWKRANAIITGVFVIAILAVFPIFFHDYYFDILVVKYQFYYISVIALAAMILIITLFYLYKDGRFYDWKNAKKIYHDMSLKSIRAVDWAMIAFVVFAAISTFQSEFLYESFWGNEGRYCGLFLILLYGVSFFIITRFFRFRQWYLDAFLMAGLIACIIGILQYFKFNPLGFKTGLSDGDYKIFSSTFGNINTYTSYLALVTGVSVTLFTTEKFRARKVFYLVSTIISLMALITGISDNAYLSLIALMGLLPLYLFGNFKGIKHYILLLSILATEFLAIGEVNQAFPDHVIGIDGLFDLIAGFNGLPFVVVGLWGITVVLFIVDAKRTNGTNRTSNIGRMIWLSIMVIVAIALVFALYDVNILKNFERYGALKSYLRLNDDWGTHRGYIWRIALEIFQKFPLHLKIFGHGPDTFGIITVQNYMSEMMSRYYEKYDSAHNEYIQYLITIGIAGLGAYIALLVCSVKKMVGKAKENPAIMAIVFACVCYGVQASVNISVPIVAPIMMTLMMVGTAKGAIE